LVAEDVIHSFWAPNLAGKQDLIPGRDNTLSFVVDQPGVYRQQCAEFCGLQHAHMAMVIVAESPDAFEAWRQGQLAEATVAATPDEELGQKVFVAKSCSACHAIRGTAAAGRNGPDLTHVGGRQYIAAGVLPTTRGSLAAWIADPQTIKPGNNMPLVALSATELNAVSAYLAALK
jgi:cytochrome c oxidase subunit 2